MLREPETQTELSPAPSTLPVLYWYAGMPTWHRMAGRNIGPWLDPLTMRIVGRFQIPVSAMASRLATSPEATELMAEAMRLTVTERAVWMPLGQATYRGHERFRAAARTFDKAFFDGTVANPEVLQQISQRWQARARNLTQMNGGLATFVRRAQRQIPWNISALAEMPDPSWDGALPIPDPSATQESAHLERNGVREYWLRGPSAPGPDCPPPIAHVFEPLADRPLPTLVFCHGIGMEQELWGMGREPLMPLLRQGFRLVFPDAPFHSRRRAPGKLVAAPLNVEAPAGILTYLPMQAAELTSLITWLRESGRATRVALGGVSLGALTSQYALGWMKQHAPKAVPDAALLITTANSVLDATFDGALIGRMGIRDQLTKHGWTRETLQPWLHLNDPLEEAPIDPNHIHVVLGSHDVVLPFASGVALADRWHIPAENRYIMPLGHFSTYVGLLGRPTALQRLSQFMQS